MFCCCYCVKQLSLREHTHAFTNLLTEYFFCLPSPVYGVIFLFRYPTGEKKRSDGRPESGSYDPEAGEKFFFARQTIQNACGTQALLSVLLNQDDDLDIGPQLKDFKSFAEGLPFEVSGS